jgi:hypothetical protein
LKLLQEWGKREIKENDGVGDFKYEIVDNIVRTFANTTLYPQYNNKKLKIKKVSFLLPKKDFFSTVVVYNYYLLILYQFFKCWSSVWLYSQPVLVCFTL